MEKMPVALPDAFAVDPAGAHCDQCDTEEDPEDGIILSGDGQTRKQGLPAFWRTRLRCQIPHPRSGERGYAAESCSRVRQNAGGRLMSLSLFSASLSLFGRSLSPFGQSLSPFGQSLSPFGVSIGQQVGHFVGEGRWWPAGVDVGRGGSFHRLSFQRLPERPG